MRKKLYLNVVLAAAAMTFFACQRVEVDVTPEVESHTVSFILGDASATKTEINGTGTAAQWTSGDAANFRVWENDTEGTDITLNTSTGVLTATFTGTPAAAEYTYTANMAGSRTGAPNLRPKVPTAQTSTASSYDPNADVLIAKPMTFGSVQSSGIALQFARPVVINKMTLKGLDGGETVSTVAISADKDLTGYIDLSNNTWSAQSSTITITVNQVVPSSGPTEGQIDVYFITMPVTDVTLTVTATSNNYIYSKTFASTISFQENKFTRFGVSSLTKTIKEDYSGTYVLTNAAGTKMATAWASGNNVPAVDVTKEEGIIYFDPDAASLSSSQITVTKISAGEYTGKYTMVQNEKYLYAADGGNYLKGQAEPSAQAYWEISCVEGAWSISQSASKLLRNNGNFFSCYGAGQTAIALFSTTDKVKATPVITASNIEIESDAVSTPTSTGATFNSNTSSVAAVAYDNAGLTEDSTWLTASVDGTTVKYTASANETGSARTAYIKITATNSESRSVVKSISVTQTAAGAAYYEKVANKASISLGQQYLVVAHGYAMPHPATSSSSTLAGTSVTINNNKISKTDALEALEFTISAGPTGTYNDTPYDYSSNYLFGFESNSSTVYVYSVGSNSTKFRASANAVYNGNPTGVWSISEGVTGYAGGTFAISNVAYYSTENRYILCNNSTFGTYAISYKSYYLVDLYKLVTPAP